MKYFIILSLIISSIAFAKRDVDLGAFSMEFNKNIDEVLEDNPEVYETKPVQIKRGPASVTPIETIEKLDQVEEQADGFKDW